MASGSQKRSATLNLVLSGFLILWLVVAIFPFAWTFWGSFKVEGDFFSKASWQNALFGPDRKSVV